MLSCHGRWLGVLLTVVVVGAEVGYLARGESLTVREMIDLPSSNAVGKRFVRHYLGVVGDERADCGWCSAHRYGQEENGAWEIGGIGDGWWRHCERYLITLCCRLEETWLCVCSIEVSLWMGSASGFYVAEMHNLFDLTSASRLDARVFHFSKIVHFSVICRYWQRAKKSLEMICELGNDGV